ncbi:MAG: mannose-1-phosphate guanylyltransferase/mannose-6-phosphate isomerase [Desulfatibacillaceae bacterium]
MIVPVILAGGSGTRLWPLSRDLYPKQLLSLTGDRTMFQCTLDRLAGFAGTGDPIIICNENHRFFVTEQLEADGRKASGILLEPVGRNTAPALAVAALHALEGGGDPLLCVLPADHYMEDTAAFHAALDTAGKVAEQGYCVTFGVVPTAPETGYGYIRVGPVLDIPANTGEAREPRAIDRFVEKPDRETAGQYLESGDYLWNSGMFVFRAGQVLEELERHAPDILEACRTAYGKGRSDLDFYRLDPAAFSACRADSIDYAVMERTDRGAVVYLDAGWNDLGSWEALWQAGDKDGDNNVLLGDVYTHDVRDSYVHASNRLVAAVGLSDHIVVESSDAVLIAPRGRVQEVKNIVSALKAEDRPESRTHRKVFRPWGSYESLVVAERFQVKRIIVKPGARLSSQKHYHRAEHWVVVHGTAMVTRGDETVLLQEDESAYIPLGTVHRLENPGRIPLELIEVQSGSYLGEDDIERFDDDYGRKA